MNNLTKLKLQHKFSRNTNKVVETILSWIAVLEKHLEKLDERQDAADAALLKEITNIDDKAKAELDVLLSQKQELQRKEAAALRNANAKKREAEGIVKEIKDSNEADRTAAKNLLKNINTLVS